MSLSPPQNLDLPYFAYGLFQAGELCHPRVEPFLSVAPVSDRIHGSLLVRDGLPLVSLHAGNGHVEGSVLHFRVETRRNAYEEVAAFEPSAHYRWTDTTTIVTGLRVNILVIRSPSKGTPRSSTAPAGRTAMILCSATACVSCQRWRTISASCLSDHRPPILSIGHVFFVYRWRTFFAGQLSNATQSLLLAPGLNQWRGSRSWVLWKGFRRRYDPELRARALSRIREV
jgi:hypothetical protein